MSSFVSLISYLFNRTYCHSFSRNISPLRISTSAMHSEDRGTSNTTRKRWNRTPETFTTGKTSKLLEGPIPMAISMSASIRNDSWTDIPTASRRISLFTFRLRLLASIKSTCSLCTGKRIQGMEHAQQGTTRLMLFNKLARIKKASCKLRPLLLMIN